MMETFETFWDYCTSNNRVCPQPQKWSELYNMLKNTRQLPSSGWNPPLPLILAAWWDSSDLSKQERFREHIQWALDNQQIEQIGVFLRSLKENDWLHSGEV